MLFSECGLPIPAWCCRTPGLRHYFRARSRYRSGHDAFAFVAPLPAEVVATLDFPQPRPGAENVVVHALRQANRTVLNPCLDPVVYHVHCSAWRHLT